MAEKRYHVATGIMRTVQPPKTAPIHAMGINPADSQKGAARLNRAMFDLETIGKDVISVSHLVPAF